jgi:hypothetical protein
MLFLMFGLIVNATGYKESIVCFTSLHAYACEFFYLICRQSVLHQPGRMNQIQHYPVCFSLAVLAMPHRDRFTAGKDCRTLRVPMFIAKMITFWMFDPIRGRIFAGYFRFL